jgi:hypothetical protein
VVPLARVRQGVYDLRHFTGLLRLVVVHELPQQEHNSLLHLFSARTDLLRYGATHYRLRSQETSTLLLQLFERYRLEATLMPDMLEQFAEETIEELLKKLPAEKLLKRLSPEERLNGLSLDDLLAALPPEKRAALAKRLKDTGK